MRGFFFSLLIVVFVGGPAAYADSFRCGSYIAKEDVPSSELVEECGQPDLVRTVEDPILVRRPNGTTFQNGISITHYWYYERGPNEFVARVTVRDARVEKIDLLSARLLESLDLD